MRWKFENTLWIFLYVSIALVYARGLFLPVMDVDSAQYASISREMATHGEFLQVQHRGRDYLDKPPLLFWTSAWMFKIFGVHEFTFRICSFLITLLGVWSTYRLGKLLYDQQVGKIAALLLISAQATYLMNHDVRTDTMLMGLTIFSIWQLVAYMQTHRKRYFIGAFVGMGLAMMSKGPIGLMVPVLALSGYFIGNKMWSAFVRPQWLLGILITLITLSPMMYGLYQQYDAQPEKVTYISSANDGEMVKGISGLKFFFWTQSFGRLTGENVWQDDSGPFFFVHNFLWSFLPWSILAIAALFYRIRKNLQHPKEAEWLTVSGVLISFIALSTSKFKLPHYIFVFYPLIALFTADFLYNGFKNLRKALRITFKIIHLFSLLLITSLGVIIMAYFFPEKEYTSVILWLLCSSMIIVSLLKLQGAKAIILSGLWISVSINAVLNFRFYPELFKFQASKNLSAFMDQKNIANEDVVVSHGRASQSFEFYRNHFFRQKNFSALLDNLDDYKDKYLYITEADIEKLQENNLSYEVIFENTFFHITKLNIHFLKPSTREKTLKHVYLVKIT